MQDFRTVRVIDGKEYILKEEAIQILQGEYMKALNQATSAVKELTGAVGGIETAIQQTKEEASKIQQDPRVILG